MAKILSNKQCSGGRPRAFFTLYGSKTKRTPTSATVTFTLYTSLQYPTSYLGTGYGLKASVYFGGSWHSWTVKSTSSAWNGDGSHKTEVSFTVPANATGSTMSVSLKVTTTKSGAPYLNTTKCSSVTVGSVTATYDDLRMSTSSITQAKGTAKLYGLPSGVGYTRTVKWYVGGSYKGYTSVSSSSSSTSFTATGLQPYSTYPVVAKVYYGDTKLGEKSITISTPQETGELTLTPKATYITAQVGSMFLNPNYKRSIDFYVKRTTDDTYIKFSTLSSQSSSCEDDITGLVSNVFYDIKAVIRNGTRALRTLEASALTLKDEALVPTAKIQTITQPIGKLECTVTWISDKLVAGTTYTLQAKTTGSWATLKTMTSVESPVVVQVAEGNVDTFFRIISKNEAAAAGVTNISNEYKLYIVDKFVWDIDKVAGTPMVITANEWNRLREYAVLRNEEASEIIDEYKTVDGHDVISIDDASIVEHNVACKVESANLTDMPNVNTGSLFYARIDFAEISAEKCTVSFNTTANVRWVEWWYNNVRLNATKTSKGADGRIISTVADISKIDRIQIVLGQTETNADITDIMLNKGTTPLPYTPYVPDLTKVKVSRLGKNLFDKSNIFNGYFGGSEVVAKNNHRILFAKVPMDADVTISRDIIPSDYPRFSIAFADEPPKEGTPLYDTKTDDTAQSLTGNSGNHQYLICWFFFMLSTVDLNAAIDSIQVEVGSAPTPHEPYQQTDYTPLPDGTVEGVTSIGGSPNMTILSQEPGLDITATYATKITANRNVDVPIVRQGEPITADVYNRMKKAINNVSFVDVPNKVPGDAIRASDVDALRVAINKVK